MALSSAFANLKLMIFRFPSSLQYTTKKTGGGSAISKATNALNRGGQSECSTSSLFKILDQFNLFAIAKSIGRFS
jgi:hypothetical protein